jgi:DNA-binding NarL/FixJ family response regulator
MELRWPGCDIHEGLASSTASGCTEVGIENLGTGRELIIFVDVPSREVVSDHIRSGTTSLIAIDASAEELEAAFSALLSGPIYISPAIVQSLVVNHPSSSESVRLTNRELEVLRLVTAGHSNREMAERLYVSPNTVRSHLQSISGRLGVSSRGKLAARARELRLS